MSVRVVSYTQKARYTFQILIMLTYARGNMEGGLPVVDLPMSEKAGILADMIIGCLRQPTNDFDCCCIGSAAGFAYADSVFQNCKQRMTVNLCDYGPCDFAWRICFWPLCKGAARHNY